MAQQQNEYFEPGVLKAWFVPTIAAASLIPTAAEVNGGTPLHTCLKQGGIEGFEFNNELVPFVKMDTAFEGKVPGIDKVGNATLRFLRNLTNEGAIKTALSKGAAGHIVIFGPGTSGALGVAAAGDKGDIWKGVVTGTSNDHPTGNEVAGFHVSFGCNTPPAQDKAIT